VQIDAGKHSDAKVKEKILPALARLHSYSYGSKLLCRDCRNRSFGIVTFN